MDLDNRHHWSTTLAPVEPSERRAEITLWVLVLGTAFALAIATLMFE